MKPETKEEIKNWFLAILMVVVTLGFLALLVGLDKNW